MWKHKNFINLQLCAGSILETTINFDSHISQVSLLDTVWSESGVSIAVSAYTTNPFIVTLLSGYIIDTVTSTNTDVVVSNITETTFNIEYNGLGDDVTITITSKQSTPTPSLTFKHFYDAGTIGTGTIKFRHYSQQEPSSGETWVLNEEVSFDLSRVNVDFTSNNEKFNSISSTSSGKFEKYLTYNRIDGYALLALRYTSEGYLWKDQAYRTITFATAPTGDLLTWLQANGTKQ